MSTSPESNGHSQESNPGSSSSSSAKTGVSLRGLLNEAVFVGAEDLVAKRAVDRADKCQPGDIFVPQHTAARDEHDRADEAIRRGAVGIVAERLLPVSVPQCLVENTQEAYAKISQELAGNPSQRMLTIGVVGTYGKTTTALYVAAMLKRLGGAVAYYTSLGASDSQECDRSATRAPGARRLAKWMQKADLAGSPAAVVELTPAMLHQRVADGVEFDLLIVTGMRPGQYRGSPSGRVYQGLLNRLCDRLKSHGMLLYNADDAQVSSWVSKMDLPAISYGLDAAEHVRAKRLSRHGGQQQLLAIAGTLLMPLTLNIPGDHVARAAMAAVATSWMFDLSVPDAIAGIESLDSIPGRMFRLSKSVDVPIYIDAGETPDRVAVAMHALFQHQLGPTTVVVDVGSHLEPKWRQRLGEVLEKTASKVVLSASDLSAEAAQALMMDVLGGIQSPGRVEVIADRRAAIEWAIENTLEGAILLSGCGLKNWVNREGIETTDELTANELLQAAQEAAPMPNLAIFPPNDGNFIFPIDS